MRKRNGFNSHLSHYVVDGLPEWLMGMIRNHMGSSRIGSTPITVVFLSSNDDFLALTLPRFPEDRVSW